MNPIRAFVLLAVLSTGTLIAAEAPAEKWRIHFQGSAASAGELHFRLTPQSGEPMLVKIKISSGQGTISMARDVIAGIKAQVPRARFKSEIMHVQDVLLKSGHGEPAFTLELVEYTVEGSQVFMGPA
jgi:hypothetical protein